MNHFVEKDKDKKTNLTVESAKLNFSVHSDLLRTLKVIFVNHVGTLKTKTK